MPSLKSLLGPYGVDELEMSGEESKGLILFDFAIVC